MSVNLGRRKNPLRKRAERLLGNSPRDLDELSKFDAQSLIQELQVHQVELEIQNEELRRVQADLEGSRDKYADLYNSAPVGYFTLNGKGTILEVNIAGAKLLGVERGDLIKQGFSRYVLKEDQPVFYNYRKRLLENPNHQTCELKMLKEDRTPFHSQLEGVAVFGSEGSFNHLRVAVLDVTARKQAEEVLKTAHDELETRVRERTEELAGANEALQAEIIERKWAEEQTKSSLKEKEVLLKEIHHRVKNNLQIVSSLIGLQARRIDDERIREEFKESQARIKSMALIHEQMYESRNLSGIDLDKCVRSLAANLFRSYGVDSGIRLSVDMNNVFLSIDKAIPCSLILNELISNSLKHAFPQEKKGEIRVALYSDSDRDDTSSCLYTLIVSDSGVGFPGDLDFRSTESLGLQIVQALTRQLKGTIELDTNNGTEFRITFSP